MEQAELLMLFCRPNQWIWNGSLPPRVVQKLTVCIQPRTVGGSVVIVDADPERGISQWGALPGKPKNIILVSEVSEDNIVDPTASEAQFVIVDLEVTASLMVANAIGPSDLLVIPMGPCAVGSVRPIDGRAS